MIKKRILVADRLRRPPATGFSWIDRRFLAEHAARLSHEGILLYFFLAAVADRNGLSFYRDATVALKLRMAEASVVAAREELVAHDLIACCSPLTQVLSLPDRRGVQRGGLQSVAEVLRRLQDGRLEGPSP